MESILQMIKEDARNVHLLVVENNSYIEEVHKKNFEELFQTMVIKNSTDEAYDYFLNQKSKPVELIIIEHNASTTDTLAFIEKIRLKEFNVQIIILSTTEDCSSLQELMLYSIAAVIFKPYDETKLYEALQRTLHNISEKKLLDYYVNQLELMARENVARKSEVLKNRSSQEVRVPKLTKSVENKNETPKKDDSLVEKYMIRNSVNDMENVGVHELDTIGHERIEIFRDEISKYESALCTVDHKNIQALRIVLHDVLEGIRELVRAINVLGVFPIAANAATNLIHFVENLKDVQLEDNDKRELFIDILISMLADFDKWIDLVFISQITTNIHYFDASFANTCLELEMVFEDNKKENSEEDSLEFF